MKAEPEQNRAIGFGKKAISFPMISEQQEEPKRSRFTDLKGFRHRVDGILSRVDEIERRVNEVTQFYKSRKQQQTQKGGAFASLEKVAANNQRKQKDPLQGEAACTKRMQELTRQFGTILRQISQHKWAWPFMEPVDVDGLGLDDYYKVIKKPMDFGTIRNKMEAKDGSGYKNMREIYADVRLVFTNAMIYNDDKNDVHVMAKSLLDIFERKWLQLLPKVIEEERKQKEEVTQAHTADLIAQEAVTAKIVKDTSTELNELGRQLEELREMMVQNCCRKMSTEEKRKIADGLTKLPAEDIQKALEIFARYNPSFSITSQSFDIDIDAQNESTLWRLKFFIKGKLELHAKKIAENKSQENAKRKICEALAKTAKKRSKKISS